MSKEKIINIDPLSARSLRVELLVNGNSLSTATGFPVERNGTTYLITNWHVVSGRDPDSDQPLSQTGGIPDEIRIAHHKTNTLGSWEIRSQPLQGQSGSPVWIEHPKGRAIDVVALPLQLDEAVIAYPLDLTQSQVDIVPQVAMPVSIIGYPYGLAAAGTWPIWKTGHIATDPDLDYDGRPAFLIDATTRGGMSGSPVVLRVSGGYQTSKVYVLSGGIQTRFLGIYSGRIHGQAEIGRVWRPHLINEIFENAGGPAS